MLPRGPILPVATVQNTNHCGAYETSGLEARGKGAKILAFVVMDRKAAGGLPDASGRVSSPG